MPDQENYNMNGFFFPDCTIQKLFEPRQTQTTIILKSLYLNCRFFDDFDVSQILPVSDKISPGRFTRGLNTLKSEFLELVYDLFYGFSFGLNKGS